MQMISDLVDNSLDEKSHLESSNENNKFLPLKQELKVDKLVFKYDEKKVSNVLEKINLSFPKGKYVVLTGGSGSGKSTLLELVMRFLTPNGGSIQWDGRGKSLSSRLNLITDCFSHHSLYYFSQTHRVFRWRVSASKWPLCFRQP